MKKSVAVISLGKFGIQLAISLSQKGYDVIAIDNKSDSVDEIKELVNFAVVLDATDEKAMRSVNVDTVDIAVVSMGTNVQSSLLTTALLQKLGVADIYVRSINQLQESILLSMGIPDPVSSILKKKWGSNCHLAWLQEKLADTFKYLNGIPMEIRVPSFLCQKH